MLQVGRSGARRSTAPISDTSYIVILAAQIRPEHKLGRIDKSDCIDINTIKLAGAPRSSLPDWRGLHVELARTVCLVRADDDRCSGRRGFLQGRGRLECPRREPTWDDLYNLPRREHAGGGLDDT